MFYTIFVVIFLSFANVGSVSAGLFDNVSPCADSGDCEQKGEAGIKRPTGNAPTQKEELTDDKIWCREAMKYWDEEQVKQYNELERRLEKLRALRAEIKQRLAVLNQMSSTIAADETSLLKAEATQSWIQMRKAKERALTEGGQQKSDDFENAEASARSGLTLLEQGACSEAKRFFDEAKALYEKTPLKNRTDPVAATLGSSEEEISYAMDLCRRYQDNCKSEWYDNEARRVVTLDPFVLDAQEITNRQFAEFVDDTGYVTDAEKQGYALKVVAGSSLQISGLTWSDSVLGVEEGDVWNRPVVNVSFNDASAYCEWAGKRLPTEDEWEYGARGDDSSVFPWGNNWTEDKSVWGVDGPRPVGSIPSGTSPHEHYDMAGNVWEWTATRTNEGTVLKGGSWAEKNPANLRSAARRVSVPSESHNDDGFRCAKSMDRWPE